MCITLDSLPNLGDCGKNAPGGTTVYIIIKDEVTAIPTADGATHTIQTDLTLAATKFWHTWYFTPGTCRYTSNQEGEIDGQSEANQVEIFIPKYRPEIAGHLSSLAGRDFLLIVKDSNGNTLLFGDLEKPMKCTQNDLDSGAGGTDRNGSTVAFKQIPNATHKPYFYTGAIPLT